MSDSASSDGSLSADKMSIKLEGPVNYVAWSRTIMGPLLARDVLDHVTGESVKPTLKMTDKGDNQAKLDEWRKQDNRAKGIIHMNVNNSMLTVLGDEVKTMTAKDMWDRLATHCARKDTWTSVDLQRQLMSLRLKPDSPASGEQHIATMTDIYNRLDNMGKKLPDWHKAETLLASVTSIDAQWDVFVTTQTASGELTWDKVAGGIRAELTKQSVQQLDRERQQSSASGIAAYNARANNDTHSGQKGGESGKWFCTHCRKKGHVVDTCYDLHPELKDQKRQRSYKAACVTVKDNTDAALLCRNSDKDSAGLWHVDSGAAKHLTGDKRWFKELYNCVPCTVTTADQGVLSCTQRGSVELSTRHGKFTVRNVLYVPGLTVNLLSVSVLVDTGYRVHFTKTGCTIRTSRNKLVIQAAALDNIYSVHVSLPLVYATLSATVSNKSAINWLVAHARLGHLNASSVQLLHDKRMAQGMVIPTEGSPSDITSCDGCRQGKAHRLPFPKQANFRASRPLELVHSDICGPIQIDSEPNTKFYLLTFIDDYSRFLWIAITTNKNGETVMINFNRYKSWAEKYTGFEIKMLRTDGGGEFINAQFKQYMEWMNIDSQTTTPYSPAQNGVAERMNRTILDAARSMLHASGLPMSYWVYAVQTAVYVRNRCPTKALDGITPYQAWRGEKPNLSHLRVFGCRAHMHLGDNKRNGKLAARSIPVIFIGYSNEAKAWLVLDPKGKGKGKIHVTRDVTFEESVAGSTLLPASAVVPAGATTSNSSVAVQVTAPTDTERSVIVDTQHIVETESDSDSEDEAAEPVQPSVAAEPAGTDLIDQNVQPASGSHSQPNSASQPASEPSAPAEVAPSSPSVAVVPSSSAETMPSPPPDQAAVSSRSARKRARRKLTPLERAQKELQSYNTLGNSEAAEGQERENHRAYYALAVNVGQSISEPTSYKEAISSPHRVQWERAMQEELDSIKVNNTYVLVPLPAGRQAIGCKWVYKIKRHADGSIDRFKARLVAKGYSQLYGIDFTETFAPVVRYSSLRAILALAASGDYEVHQMDVKTAFLNGDLDEDIYMEQPDGFRADGEQAHWVWKLNKSLYGLKQAGRAWNKKMDAALVELGYKPCHSDSCVYVKRDDSGVFYILVYVDDLLLVTNDTTQLAAIKAALSKRFEMKDMGEAHFILGVQITRDRANRRLCLSQAEYVRSVLERFNMQDCNSAATPMATGVKLLKDDPADEPADNVPYASAVGALMYASLATRPDIAYAVTALCQFMSKPMNSHWLAVKRVFRYLQGTREHQLVYGWNGGKEQPLYGYSDSDWGNDVNDRRSVTGWVYLLHDAAVNWQSCKQPTVALSSVEAEYMAATQATREAVWWRAFFTELGLPPTTATTVYSDSQGAIALGKNPEHHKRTKHIDIKHHYVREQVAAGTVTSPYISTDDMLADVLTKPLAAQRHIKLAEAMGVRAITPQTNSSGSVGDGE